MNFEQVTIVGPGLLGASLAMALRNRDACRRIVVWARNPERVAECSSLDWCDHADHNLEKAVSGSDIIVLCTSVESIVALLPKVISLSAEGTLLTDVGSVKKKICQVGEEQRGKGKGTFIGSHPMAGSEKSGMSHARPDLFEGKPCIVTSPTNAPDSLHRSLHDFWERVGMKVHDMSAEEHDRCVAHMSHLPHLLSSSLAHCLDEINVDWRSLSGQGLRDTTRIAEGNSDLWEQILLSNKSNVLAALADLESSISLAKNYLANEQGSELREFLETGVHFRKSLNAAEE